MKRSALALVLTAVLCAASIPLLAQEPMRGRGGRGGPPPSSTLTQARVSPHDTVSARIGGGFTAPLVVIYYGRPYSKDPNTGARPQNLGHAGSLRPGVAHGFR